MAAFTGLAVLQLGLAAAYFATCSHGLSFSDWLSRLAPLATVTFGFYELTSADPAATRVVRLGSLLCVGAALSLIAFSAHLLFQRGADSPLTSAEADWLSVMGMWVATGLLARELAPSPLPLVIFSLLQAAASASTKPNDAVGGALACATAVSAVFHAACRLVPGQRAGCGLGLVMMGYTWLLNVVPVTTWLQEHGVSLSALMGCVDSDSEWCFDTC